MPCVGLTSLHPTPEKMEQAVRKVCQCPVSGSRLCTVATNTIEWKIKVSANALSQAHVSAPAYNISLTALWEEVSMPCLGLASLHAAPCAGYRCSEWCQCPVSGSRLCTFGGACVRRWYGIMCQCPVSGSRLCTPPPKIPSVYAGLRPYFLQYFSELSDF